jgi:chorismate mutase
MAEEPHVSAAPAEIENRRRRIDPAPAGPGTDPPDRDSLPDGRKSDDDPDRGRGRSAAPAEIENWRRRIDTIDSQLMRLLNSRSACAVEIGRIKRALGLPIYSPEREAQILERVGRENPGPLDALAVRRVFERIVDEGRRLERLACEHAPPDEEEQQR